MLPSTRCNPEGPQEIDPSVVETGPQKAIRARGPSDWQQQGDFTVKETTLVEVCALADRIARACRGVEDVLLKIAQQYPELHPEQSAETLGSIRGWEESRAEQAKHNKVEQLEEQGKANLASGQTTDAISVDHLAYEMKEKGQEDQELHEVLVEVSDQIQPEQFAEEVSTIGSVDDANDEQSTCDFDKSQPAEELVRGHLTKEICQLQLRKQIAGNQLDIQQDQDHAENDNDPEQGEGYHILNPFIEAGKQAQEQTKASMNKIEPQTDTVHRFLTDETCDLIATSILLNNAYKQNGMGQADSLNHRTDMSDVKCDIDESIDSVAKLQKCLRPRPKMQQLDEDRPKQGAARETSADPAARSDLQAELNTKSAKVGEAKALLQLQKSNGGAAPHGRAVQGKTTGCTKVPETQGRNCNVPRFEKRHRQANNQVVDDQIEESETRKLERGYQVEFPQWQQSCGKPYSEQVHPDIQGRLESRPADSKHEAVAPRSSTSPAPPKSKPHSRNNAPRYVSLRVYSWSALRGDGDISLEHTARNVHLETDPDIDNGGSVDSELSIPSDRSCPTMITEISHSEQLNRVNILRDKQAEIAGDAQGEPAEGLDVARAPNPAKEPATLQQQEETVPSVPHDRESQALPKPNEKRRPQRRRRWRLKSAKAQSRLRRTSPWEGLMRATRPKANGNSRSLSL